MLTVKEYCEEYAQLHSHLNSQDDDSLIDEKFKQLFKNNPNTVYFIKNGLEIHGHDYLIDKIGYLKTGHFVFKFTGGIYSINEQGREVFHGTQKIIVKCGISKSVKLNAQKNDIISTICSDGKSFGLVSLSHNNNTIVQTDVIDILNINIEYKGDIIPKTQRFKF